MDASSASASSPPSNGFDFPLLADVDGAVARAYGVKRSSDLLKVRRTTFVIGADGVVLAVIASELQHGAPTPTGRSAALARPSVARGAGTIISGTAERSASSRLVEPSSSPVCLP